MPHHDQPASGATVHHFGRPGSRKLAKLCIAFVIFHLAMTALYLGPTPGPLRTVATRYMEPVFKQSWWVFAPDPVSSNVYLSVRGRKSDGSLTPWFNVTSCDIKSAILHHPVPDRRYLATFQLLRHYQLGLTNLPPAAVEPVRHDVTGPNWAETLRSQLLAKGATKAEANNFLKSARAMNLLGSDIAAARWGTVDRVQIKIDTVYTRPFSERNTNVPLKHAARQPGATPFSAPSKAELATVSDLYGPKGGC